MLPPGWKQVQYDPPNRQYKFYSRFHKIVGFLGIHYSLFHVTYGVKVYPADVDVFIGVPHRNSTLYKKHFRVGSESEVKEIQRREFEKVARRFYND